MSLRLACLTSIVALTAGPSIAEMNFNRIANFATPRNMAQGEDRSRETSPEIIAVTHDGLTLVYTDSPLGAIGRIDIADPRAPKPLGNIALEGEPTSVDLADRIALVGVNTSPNYVAPSGHLSAINIDSGAEIGRCDLGGQPDSVAIAPDRSFVAIAIENERDEDLNGGALPQYPAGHLAILPLTDGAPDCSGMNLVDMTGLAEVAPSDPEPEYVDINAFGEIVVTLQENNHLVIVSRDGAILNHFSAGTADIHGIDTAHDGALNFTRSKRDVPREPDAVAWVDTDHFAIANEGDYQGGTRGWSIFAKDGTLVYDSGSRFEHAIVEIGHYPEKRSGKKGVEPEEVTVATINGKRMIFVSSERGSVVGVYDATNPAAPTLTQLLPSGIAPEGILAIPQRNLLVTANEKDLIDDGGPRAHVMIFEYQNAPATYPMLTSQGMGTLTGWGAHSGMVGDGQNTVWAVNDSFYAMQPTIYKIDTAATPARITDAIRVTRSGQPAQKLDMEGITLDGNGGFWVASEGRTDRLVPHALLNVNAKGEIIKEVGLPPELMAVEKRFGFEGITRVGDTLWMPVQREWKDDPKNLVKLVSYNTKTQQWGAVHYRKSDPQYGWVGLSEITAYGDWFYVIERDNQHGDRAVTKKIYRIAAAEMIPAPLGGDLPVVTKDFVRDLIPDMVKTGGYVLDKVEGLAIMADGRIFVSTDNDGVDDHSGETLFWHAGTVKSPTH